MIALAANVIAACDIASLPRAASGAIGTGKVLAVSGVEGRWSGAVQPNTPNCGGETHGLMRVGDGAFAFDPFQSTILVDGKVEHDRLQGVSTRIGGQHQTLSISFDGRARSDDKGDDVIEGRLSSGRCTWTVTLSRA